MSAQNMLYYLAWEEDDWLDEILDYFRSVNAVVPTAKTLQFMKEQRAEGVARNAVVVLNAAHEPEKSMEFLHLLQNDDEWKNVPLYIVGLEEHQEAEWQAAFPRANIVVIRGSKYEFDYEAVLKEMNAEWSD